MRRFTISALLLLALTATALPLRTRAYTLQWTNAQGTNAVRWSGNYLTLALAPSLVNPPANIKATSDEVLLALRRAMQHWTAAANLNFIETTAKTDSVSDAARRDGLNLITLARTAENDALFAAKSADAVGRTRAYADANGKLIEADIALNPRLEFSADGAPGTYDLEAAFTHEIGHLIGMEHSTVLGAAMYPQQARNGLFDTTAWTGRTLAEDDIAGARALYGAPANETGNVRGAIAGTLTLAGGVPAFGARIWAEEVRTGRVVAGALTLPNGNYRLDNLRAGTYRLTVESWAHDGTLQLSEIVEAESVYGALLKSAPAVFRAQEFEWINVKPNQTTWYQARLNSDTPTLNPALLGYGEDLASVAVPLVAGRTYQMWLACDGLTEAATTAPSDEMLRVTSPFFQISSVRLSQEFKLAMPVYSFELRVSDAAPSGEYTLRLQTPRGEAAYLTGGITLESADTARATLPQIAKPQSVLIGAHVRALRSIARNSSATDAVTGVPYLSADATVLSEAAKSLTEAVRDR